MASPVFKKRYKTKTTSSKRKSYLPVPHHCQGCWQATKEEFNTCTVQYCVIWDEFDGWCLAKEEMSKGRDKNVTYKGSTFHHLTRCPFCGEALKVVNQVSIE